MIHCREYAHRRQKFVQGDFNAIIILYVPLVENPKLILFRITIQGNVPIRDRVVTDEECFFAIVLFNKYPINANANNVDAIVKDYKNFYCNVATENVCSFLLHGKQNYR